MKIFFCLALVILMSTCFAEITSSPGLQRLNIGDNCTFRWTLSDSIITLQISNQTSGGPPRQGANYSYDAYNKVIILNITNVQLWDAGNYSLVINGQTPNAAYSACLFVYGPSAASVILTRGTNPATEGDSVELTCDITSTSLPAAYSPKWFIYWYMARLGLLEYVSSGPAMLYNKPVPDHSIKNDGRTLVIDSVKHQYDSGFECGAFEDGSRAGSHYSQFFTLLIRYRPDVFSISPDFFSISSDIFSISPSTRRLTAVVGTDVSFWFMYESWPEITSMTNWSFTDTAGNRRNLPAFSLQNYSDTNPTLRFNFTSETYYGKYWIMLTNDVGSTTVEFQVLRAGVPDSPSTVQLFYVSHSAIYINWNVMFANSVDYKQTVFVRVISQDTGIEIETQSRSFSDNVYNVSYYSLFQNNIQPKSNYEVRVWATNVYGQSSVVSLFVRTRSQPKLNVSPKTISVNGSQATINFTLVADDLENITSVYASCCSALSGLCAYSYFDGIAAPNQIVIDSIPNGTDLIFDLTVYCGVYQRYNYMYFSAMAIGIKVSRNESYQNEDSTSTGPSNNFSTGLFSTTHYVCSAEKYFPTTDMENRLSDKECPYLAAVVVLAVLFGIAVLGLIGCLVAYLVSKSRSSMQPTHLEPKVAAVRFRDPTMQETPIDADPYSNYESMHESAEHDQNYTTS